MLTLLLSLLLLSDPAAADPQAFSLRAFDSRGDSLILHRGTGLHDFSQACQVLPTDTIRGIRCKMEVPELHLFQQDIRVQVQVPAGMCAQLVERPYYFYAQPAGRGPTRVKNYLSLSGQIVDELNSRNGAPYCAFSHSGGANCCEGSYEYSQGMEDPNNPGTIQYIVTQENWGGSVNACLAGPGTQAEYLDRNGLPQPKRISVQEEPYEGTFLIPSAARQNWYGQTLRSNVYAANFFSPKDHKDGRPRAMRKPGHDLPSPQTTYQWDCLDRGNRIKAQIHLQIRDWNGLVQETGDPEQGQNNYKDWLDFGDAFPDAEF